MKEDVEKDSVKAHLLVDWGMSAEAGCEYEGGGGGAVVLWPAWHGFGYNFGKLAMSRYG